MSSSDCYLISVEDNLTRIVKTLKGERVLNFILGGDVSTFIDKRLTGEEATLLKYHIYDTARLYEPRIEITQIDLIFKEDRFEVDITYLEDNEVKTYQVSMN